MNVKEQTHELREQALKMSQKIRHRGPDWSGIKKMHHSERDEVPSFDKVHQLQVFPQENRSDNP